jgi:type VI secretion system protein ImpJ
MMPAFRKVIWTEGTLLAQQHLQLWDQQAQHYHQKLIQSLSPFGWGILQLEYDESYLPQGVLQLTKCTALLKDGRLVDYNATTDGPLSINLPENHTDFVNVYLLLAQGEGVEGISGYPSNPNPSHLGEYTEITDVYDATRKRELLLGKQNLSLSVERPSQTVCSCLPVVALSFDPNQMAYKLNKSFIPPVLRVGASSCLVSWVADMTGKLTTTIHKLNEQKAKHRHVHNQFGYGDFVYFNLVKSLTSFLPRFTSIQSTPMIHPYSLYQLCLSFIGELWGYLDKPLSQDIMPNYKQDELGALFDDMKRYITSLIDNVMPANTIDVSLHKISETLHYSIDLSREELGRNHYCLGIYHEDMTDDLIEKITAQIKIASPKHIKEIVQSFTQGIQFNYLATPGKDLMAKRHYHYFLLDKQSIGWQAILEEGKMAIFVSQALSNLTFELITYA